MKDPSIVRDDVRWYRVCS